MTTTTPPRFLPPPSPGRLLRTVGLLVALLVLPASLAAQETSAAPNEPAPYTLEEVTAGVWLARRPEAYTFADSNSVIVETDGGLLVVDAQADPATSRWLAEELQRRFDRPVRWLVVSHWHGDHTQGLAAYRQVFGDGVEILAHTTWWQDVQNRGLPQLAGELDATREAIERAAAELAAGRGLQGEDLDFEGRAALAARLERNRQRVARLAAVEIPPPTISFSDRVVLHRRFRGEARPIHLLPFRGHTRGDVVIHLPAERLAVTGDLLDVLPFGGHGHLDSWLDSLERLQALEYRWVLPGHGPVQEGTEHLHRVRDLFRFLVAQARAAVAAGEGPEAARQTMMASPGLEPHRRALAGDDPRRGRAFDQFVPATFDRAYLEAANRLSTEPPRDEPGEEEGGATPD